ncbi:hypothetical protein SDC9_190817 [bioreactor metagenome]|uniref:Uncharacterized protein n=1 Tax=bioreactor metagenome TaxID=1076179 RepID=A0A645HW67_9ZZZZ
MRSTSPPSRPTVCRRAPRSADSTRCSRSRRSILCPTAAFAASIRWPTPQPGRGWRHASIPSPSATVTTSTFCPPSTLVTVSVSTNSPTSSGTPPAPCSRSARASVSAMSPISNRRSPSSPMAWPAGRSVTASCIGFKRGSTPTWWNAPSGCAARCRPSSSAIN